MRVIGAFALELAQQRRPNKRAAQTTGLHPHGVGHAVQYLRVHSRQVFGAGLARQRIHLDAAGVLKGVHRQEGVGNGFAHGEQAVIAQHQEIGRAQIGLQAQLFFVVNGHALVAMVGQRSQHKRALLADGQHAVRLCAHGYARPGVGVQYTTGIGPRLVHRAVDHKARRIDRKGAVVQLVALHVHLDQAGRGDFVKHQAIGIDQKLMVLTRDRLGQLGADVGEHQIAPAVKRHQPVTRGQVQPQLPFIGVNAVFQRRNLKRHGRAPRGQQKGFSLAASGEGG